MGAEAARGGGGRMVLYISRGHKSDETCKRGGWVRGAGRGGAGQARGS